MATGGDIAHWLKRASLVLPLLLAAFLAIALVGVALDPVHDRRQLTGFLFIRQDLAMGVLLALLLRYGLRPGLPTSSWDHLGGITRRPWLISILLALFCWSGHYWLFQGYDLTRDEQLANFDAAIYAHGRLFWTISDAWRPFADALNQFFMLPIAGRQAWVSGYLPVNALARAGMAWLGDPALTSPVFTAIGALALWRIAARLWPEDRQALAVALLLYAGSSQVVMQGMTAHAMAGHLALNLVWLWLFLRGGRNHGAAVAVGFLATGLHQPLFHPLFALPFLIGLVRQRRWTLSATYALAYAAICLFWLTWPNMIANLAGGPLADLSTTGDRLGYADRAAAMLHDFGPISGWLMAMNIVRFIAWQHILMLPLVAAAATLAWRAPLVRPLLAGILLHLVVVGLLLAYQGHGWGYRYLHGVIGNTCLLGACGWRVLRPAWPSSRLWAWGNGISFGILLPVHLAMAAWLTLPYARVSASIDRMPADVVIVDNDAVAFGADLVFNRPDLSNRPIRLLGGSLNPVQVASLCQNRRVLFAGAANLIPVSRIIETVPPEQKRYLMLKASCQNARRQHPQTTFPARSASDRTRSGSS